MCIWIFDDPRNNLRELRTSELSHFWQLFCTVGCSVCVINSSHSFQGMFLKLCRHFVDILKMCMWVLG